MMFRPFRTTAASLAIVGLALLTPVLAVDVSPSRRTVPQEFIDPPGKRFSLFAGDPERVQRANEVKLESFSATLFIAPTTLSLSKAAADSGLEFNFVVTNHDKKRQTLSFPDAQRYDLAIVTPQDELVYLWSEDKAFAQSEGMSFLNTREMLSFREVIPLSKLRELVIPGNYRVVMILANYPELKATAEFVVEP